MKYFFYFLICGFFFCAIAPCTLRAQIFLDSATVRCEYYTKWKPDSAQSQYNDDLVYLDIGPRGSLCYSRYTYFRDSTRRAMMERGADEYLVQEETRLLRRGLSSIVGKQYNDNRLTVSESLVIRVIYSEVIPQIAWRITQDTCTILSYLCRKAIAQFRGRDWEAWFCTEIPLQTGPFQFGGLPGLILKLSDTKQNYIFEAIELKMFKQKSALLIEDRYIDGKPYQRTSRERYKKQEQEFYSNPTEYLKTYLGVSSVTLSNRAGQVSTSPTLRQSYNPIELR